MVSKYRVSDNEMGEIEKEDKTGGMPAGDLSAWIVGALAVVAVVYFFRPATDADSNRPIEPKSVQSLPAPASLITNNVPAKAGEAGAEAVELRQEGVALFPIIHATAQAATEAEKAQWMGAKVCGECHSENYESALKTSHYRTSGFASDTNLLGAFDGPDSWMKTSDPSVKYRMFRDEGRHFQSVVQNGVERHRASIDIIVGSGKLAQTYGSWVKDDLFELPLSALRDGGRWVNSPGYPDGFALFDRPLNNGCLVCHATGSLADGEGEFVNRFKSRHIVAGITCEKCHGFGKEHVDYHRAHPDEKFAKHILAPRKLTMVENHALCSQCHGGLTGRDAEIHKPGVHSNNQLPRLQKSKCYTGSGGMSCVACHNPHRFERGNNRLFAQRCQSCHKVEDCGEVTPERRKHFSENCAECHMKKEIITDISFQTREGKVEVEMVDHFIRVFREGE